MKQIMNKFFGQKAIQEQVSFKEMEKRAHRRITEVNKELKKTFNFLKFYPKSVTVFGSARTPEDHPDYIRARHLTQRIARELKYTVITGGSGGIMEAANRGAFEAKGKSVGMNVVLPNEQKNNSYLTAHMKFYYFFIRKVALSFSAEAYIYFPGGFGTMDEFFEIVTLIQTKKIPKVPVICVGRKYWEGLDAFIKKAMLEDNKLIDPADTNVYKIVDSDDEIIDIIKRAPLRKE